MILVCLVATLALICVPPVVITLLSEWQAEQEHRRDMEKRGAK